MKLSAIVVALALAVTAHAQFTAAQSAAGATAYQTACSNCHAADLGGRNEAPQLAGSNFIGIWGTRTAGELVAYIQTSMPPTNAGSLGEAASSNLAAYILQSNGAAAGNQTLARASNTVIRSVATGRVSVAGGAAAASGPTGITVSGTVKNLRPRHRRDAAQSRSRRLAHDPPQLSGLELQPARADHHRQREEPARSPGSGR